jgi:hypothetical protein
MKFKQTMQMKQEDKTGKNKLKGLATVSGVCTSSLFLHFNISSEI